MGTKSRPSASDKLPKVNRSVLVKASRGVGLEVVAEALGRGEEGA